MSCLLIPGRRLFIAECVCICYLGMIGAQHNPPTEAVSQINCCCTAAEADHIRKSSPERHNQDLWGKERELDEQDLFIRE